MTQKIPDAYVPNESGFDLEPFHRLITRLRDPESGCPWDKSRTLEQMGGTLVEEAGEAAEALANADHAHQCEELGDVMLNVMLAVRIAEEQGFFTWKDVITGVTSKLIRRHPHVFGGMTAKNPEEALEMFLAAKAREKKQNV